MTEFFSSMIEKWCQLAFHWTKSFLLSDYSFRLEIWALSKTECCWAHLLCLPCSECDWRVDTFCNRSFNKQEISSNNNQILLPSILMKNNFLYDKFMSRNKSIRCWSRAWPNFGLMSFSSIIYLLLCRKRQKKVVAHLAQCMLVNTKTRAYGLSHNILFSRRLCIKSSEPS